jgi:indolepyruvate ferredoxin oxidoreductase
VALIGDDPTAKSSTVPSASEAMCRSLLMPLLAPGTLAEILTLGLHAVALSRHAGLWCGLKIVADIADASSIVELDGMLDVVPEPPLRQAGEPPVLLAPTNLDAEHDLMTARLQRAREYARDAGLNRIAFEPRRPRLAVVAAGMSYQAVLRALDELGIDEGAREALGLRLVRLGMPWPLDRDEVRVLVEGVDTVLVVEDKLAFVEAQLKEALYRAANAPIVVGKDDADGRPLLSAHSALSADDVARALVRVVGTDALPPDARRRIELIEQRGR